MGCTSSGPKAPPKQHPEPPHSPELEFSNKGGSVVIPPNNSKPSTSGPTDVVDMTGNGGSVIMGVKLTDGVTNWQLGDPVPVIAPLIRPGHMDVVTSDAKMTVSYGYMSKQGVAARGPVKPNQDSLLVEKQLHGRNNCILMAVFDGHGPFGEQAATYCRERLVETIGESKHFDDDPARSVERAMPKLHKKFINDCAVTAGVVNANVSGCTALVALVDGCKLSVSNVGDSRGILLRYSDSSMEAVPLSLDHKPGRDSEAQRIQNTSASICPESLLRQGGDPSKLYVCRQIRGRLAYGVMFTRSIGDNDAHQHLGLLADAEVINRNLDFNDRHIVLATDGVWDVMTNEDVMSCVANARDAQAAAAALVNEAAMQWQRKMPDSTRDDITVLVASFHWDTNFQSAQQAAAAAMEAEAEADAEAAAMEATPDVQEAYKPADEHDVSAAHDTTSAEPVADETATSAAEPAAEDAGQAPADVADVAVDVDATAQE